MNNLNKITHTKVGDNIHYYINGQEGRGVVVKMNNAYVSVLKETGSIDEIHINDTFFVKDIVANKTWNDMTLEERTENLYKAHAYSPRFLSKTWEELPQELKDVLQKTNIEDSTHGQIGGNSAGVSTDTDVEAPEDYKGESKDDKKEEFKHEHQEKPTVDKNNGMEQDHKKKEQSDGMTEDWRPTGGESDKQKNYINKDYVAPTNRRVSARASTTGWQKMIDANAPKKKQPKAVADENTKYFDDKGNPITREEHEAYANKGEVRPDDLWKVWLEKDALKPSKQGNKPDPKQTGFGDEGSAVENPSWTSNPDTQSFQGQATHTRRAYNKPQSFRGDKYDSKKPFSKHRLTRYGGKKDVAATYQRSRTGDPRVTSDDDHMRDRTGKRQTTSTQDEQRDREELAYWRKHGKAPPKKEEGHGKDLGLLRDNSLEDVKRRRGGAKYIKSPIKKSYGKPLYGVTSLEKEGDGAGNSGVNSLETTGVYNARYSDNKGRYRDQEKDKE